MVALIGGMAVHEDEGNPTGKENSMGCWHCFQSGKIKQPGK